MHQKVLSLRIVGLIGSLVFTLLAYLIIVHPENFRLRNEVAVHFIIGLALLQFATQAIFFLDVGRDKKPYWNSHFFVATLSIIAIVIGFSVWIMDHLNTNMMPMP